MTSPKSPTPQGISALLKRAGFRRAESKMRGGCSGFKVAADRYQPGAVRVEWRPFLMSESSPAMRDHRLVGYRKAIIEAGWAVDAREYDLIVTAAPETPEETKP